MTKQNPCSTSASDATLGGVTPEQVKILAAVSRDKTFKTISEQLNRPQTQVKDAALRATEELGVNSLAAAVATAIRTRLID